MPVAGRDAAAERRIDARVRALVGAIRAKAGGLGGIEDFLHAYSLSTKEGLALMVLAEALLRVPDTATADRLIEDKLAAGRWLDSELKSTALLVSASAWTLGIAARIIHPGETPETILDDIVRRLGLPTLRTATRQAMRLIGSHFVLGQTIDEALARARGHSDFRYSYDMLGEGARTAGDAEKYFAAYAGAIEAIGASAGNTALPARPGISVKLSALHPRFEAISRERVLAELTPRLIELARLAKARDLQFTVDAEEADRLELSLEVIAAALGDRSLHGWEGFGLAVQAYQKRAPAVIDWVEQAAAAVGGRLTVRLVKGAYWDSEIKRAQERGLPDYPVFTRKAMTDLCYMACVKKLLAARGKIFPQFATHNALTVAGVIEDAGGVDGFEFQRLHGMGEALYAALLAELPEAVCRVYAPVGGHRELLAYLVRRLLENGANSSFVSVAADPNVPIDEILRRPQSRIVGAGAARNRHIPLPRDLYRPERQNSAGVEFGERTSLDALVAEIRAGTPGRSCWPRLSSTVIALPGRERAGDFADRRASDRRGARKRRKRSRARRWRRQPPVLPPGRRRPLDERAGDPRTRRRLVGKKSRAAAGASADRRRQDAGRRRFGIARGRRLLPLLRRAGARRARATNDARPDRREQYAALSRPRRVRLHQPVEFPAGDFPRSGRRRRSLAGNTVVAKPAEQTPLDRRAGRGAAAPGWRAARGAASSTRRRRGRRLSGRATPTSPASPSPARPKSAARSIGRLPPKSGPIVPLIAETGGVNAMIVDATALPEQVTDDVIISAFRSAGQRCSALRLLCLQADVADAMLAMLIGAASELKVGDPREPSTHVGPVIDAEAREKLEGWIAAMQRAGRLVYRWDGDAALPAGGTYVVPAIVELDNARELKDEVFGPVLHVVRWQADQLMLSSTISPRNGTALTLGIHSRIDLTVERVAARLPHGNVYVNRSMIGAVVGTQPFGGTGLSGTGPKAGGPNYLRRFAAEQVVTVNTAASGGNAGLLAQED